MKRTIAAALSVAFACGVAWAGGSGEDSSDEVVTIEFIQWWEPELPAGAFRAIMDDFEARNPGIRVELISGPYANTRDQIVTGAATGTLSDVVGLDGAWVNDLAKQGAIAPLDGLIAETGFDAA